MDTKKPPSFATEGLEVIGEVSPPRVHKCLLQNSTTICMFEIDDPESSAHCGTDFIKQPQRKLV